VKPFHSQPQRNQSSDHNPIPPLFPQSLQTPSYRIHSLLIVAGFYAVACASVWKSPLLDPNRALFRPLTSPVVVLGLQNQRAETEMSETNTAAQAPHGTPERWQADCDCSECCDAMRNMVWESDLDSPSFRVLRDMLYFRVRGCELYVVPAMVSEQAGVCCNTVRRRIDRLVEVGALSKVDDIKGQSGRSGIYLLHVEKLKMRSELRLYRESEKLQQDNGFTKATSWRMMMLKEHEASSGDPCVKCGNFPVDDGGFCAHCYVGRNEHLGVRCPVCQGVEIPKVFFEPKMQNELARVEAARTAFFQPRRLMLVKG